MNEKKHYHWIDLLRFVSAFLVVLAHYRGKFFVEYGLLPDSNKNVVTQIFYLLTRLGEEPVIVFFVLSGFLVGGRAFQRILDNKVDLRSYCVDRSVRIFLPLLASSVFVILVDLIIKVPVPVVDIIGSILSVQNILTSTNHNVPLWSLAYEVWFYVLVGCVMVILRNNRKSMVLAFLLFAASIIIFANLKTMYLLILLLGTLTFLLPRDKIRFLGIKIVILLLLFVFTILLSQFTSESRSLSIPFLSRINHDFASLSLAVVTCLLVHHLVVFSPATRLGRGIDRVSSKLSDFSYTLYLTHYPLMSLLAYWGLPKSKTINASSISWYLLSVLISLAVAYLIYLVSEKQTSKVKNLIKQRTRFFRATILPK